MATLRDLVPEAERDRPGFPQGTWFAKVIAPVPVSLVGKVHVIIPQIDTELGWGPFRWVGNGLPNLGSDAVVIFDNQQNGWVIVWP